MVGAAVMRGNAMVRAVVGSSRIGSHRRTSSNPAVLGAGGMIRAYTPVCGALSTVVV